MENQNKFNITEFANSANVSERTVRYYVKENLIDPPEGDRRGSFYTIKHLDQIKEVIALKEAMSIMEIQQERNNDIRFSIAKTEPASKPCNLFEQREHKGCLVIFFTLMSFLAMICWALLI